MALTTIWRKQDLAFKIRPIELEDAPAILDIYQHYITDTWITFELEVPSLEDFTSRIETISSSYPYLVGEVNGEVVGYAYSAKYREREAFRYSGEVSIYLSPKFQKRGYGHLLFSELLKETKNQGYHTLYSAISLPNENSVKLHKDFGFTEIGIFHDSGFKFNQWIDVIWFEKIL